MNLRSFYAEKLSPLLKRLPYGERLNMALIALTTDLQITQALYPYFPGYKYFSEEEIRNIFAGMDDRSIELALLFMRRQLQLPKKSFFIHPQHFYTAAEQMEYKKIYPDFKKCCKKYGFAADKVGFESLYYHHGLRFAPDFIKKHISGKLFGDIGGYLGDSTLIFMDYQPRKVIIFEPMQQCYQKLEQTLIKNNIPADKYEIQPFGLSDRNESSGQMDCRALDDLSGQYTTPLGLLKADIEGMGLKFIKGAEQTIRRDRPLLSLSVYHNADEFAGIYQLLKSWDLNYNFALIQLSPLIAGMELTLFAYPREWME